MQVLQKAAKLPQKEGIQRLFGTDVRHIVEIGLGDPDGSHKKSVWPKANKHWEIMPHQKAPSIRAWRDFFSNA